ncbi:cytochrome PufQ [Anianabacter salinae]|uniref:cytochrome PufQ n=1 Tax=Anianabacter salinae TaxID=2851023 RepID=UPI00225E6911|nr:cytochrome PufQ [Anianabacter salinae]MBV0914144.1 protein pufQ [Anianabacter salinae]
MADYTVDAPSQARRSGAPKTEFAVYFGIIFLATLPLATLTWALSALKQGGLPDKGPMARAWTQARIITPMIFSA